MHWMPYAHQRESQDSFPLDAESEGVNFLQHKERWTTVGSLSALEISLRIRANYDLDVEQLVPILVPFVFLAIVPEKLQMRAQ